ncbi:hypothetical protein HPP92_009241 [Vanilla planifolia]|uniref:Uncharacterized protein n=1 Tax=Vanilla planifolia TaxID=51239 RepID=A0A835R7G7_VANPL|nr:hypothetical protein HPP92_009241 [Vanilla planifolia]
MEAADVECDTELCLSPGGRLRTAHETPSDEKHQMITIFYSGNVCFSRVTEIQAKEIICMAEMMRSSSTSGGTPEATLQQLNCGVLSMKRSLQLFLQKRKNRVASAHRQPIFASEKQDEYLRRLLQDGDSSSAT